MYIVNDTHQYWMKLIIRVYIHACWRVMGKRRQHHDQSLYFPITPASISLMNEANPPPRQGQSPEKWCNYMSLNRGGEGERGRKNKRERMCHCGYFTKNENGTFTRFLSLLNTFVCESVIWFYRENWPVQSCYTIIQQQIILTPRSRKISSFRCRCSIFLFVQQWPRLLQCAYA